MEIKGFTINFLGDSITEGAGVADIESCRYDNRIKKACALAAVNNYGIGGTRIAHQIHASAKPRHDLCFCGRAYNLDKNADMVIVYGGVNDYIHGDAPFGVIGDTTPATFCGGVYFLMNYLLERFAGKPIVFMTPARCNYGNVNDLAPSPREGKNTDAKPLLAYVEVIEETAKNFNIPVLNLYRDLGIDPHDPVQYEKYTADGLHFNDDGHAILAQKLMDFIAAL
ncbi:MAG: SGNH/GDSL hydrolase family protein [Ruminococcaceae bacterium]|nr:SGNH/GDSL hydrolase family protein [Oscillospiraceae bacterium]